MRVLETPKTDGTALFCLSFTSCGRRLIGTDFGRVVIWDMSDSGPRPWRVISDDEGFGPISFSPCGRYIVEGGEGCIFVWDLRSDQDGERIGIDPHRDTGPYVSFAIVGFSPDGTELIAIVPGDSVYRWSVGTWDQLPGFRTNVRLNGRRAWANGTFAVRPTTTILAAVVSSSHLHASAEGIRCWDYRTGRALKGTTVDPVKSLDDVRELRFSPDGRRLAFARRLWRVDILDADTLKPVAVYAPKLARRRPREPVTDFAFHPSGRWFGVVGDLGRVDCVDTETGQLIRTFDWNIGPTRGIAFSPDGTLAAASGDNGTVVVWDVDE